MNEELSKIINNLDKEQMQDILKWMINTQSQETKENMLKYFKNNEKSDLIFIKNIIEVDVDGLKGINHYTIKAMYNKIDAEGYATLTHKLIDEFDYSWDDIEKDGGIVQVNKDFKETYGVEIK
jgi:hypothetical protein